jgi:mannose-6-phosphate isomerase class I
LVSVIEGSGTINGISIHQGNHFIITSIMQDVQIDGDLQLVVSHV